MTVMERSMKKMQLTKRYFITTGMEMAMVFQM